MFSRQSKSGKQARIVVPFQKPTVDMLSRLAKQEHKSVSSLIKELVLDSLEQKEDIALSDLAHARDVENTKRIKHRDAWR